MPIFRMGDRKLGFEPASRTDSSRGESDSVGELPACRLSPSAYRICCRSRSAAFACREQAIIFLVCLPNFRLLMLKI